MTHPEYSSGTEELRQALAKQLCEELCGEEICTNEGNWLCPSSPKAVNDWCLGFADLAIAALRDVAQAGPDPSLQKMQISTRNAVIEECARVADRWGDGEATMAAAEIRMLKTSSVPSTPRATTDRNLAESRCEDCPAPRCIVCPVTSTPRGGEA